MEEKKTRGGKRLGAGRKKTNGAVSKSVSLDKGKWERLEEIAKLKGTTKNKIVTSLVDDLLKSFEK